ncbi:MAG: DNA/RNA nuclease SfsA [Chloroflexota bacterium]
MVISGSLQKATFLRRLTRFSALVQRAGIEEIAYLPNSGRMKELLTPGRPVFLLQKSGSNRKTTHDLVMVRLDGALISVDAQLPNELVYQAIKKGALVPFRQFIHVRRGATYGESRFDLTLESESQSCLIEVKSCTLVRQGRGRRIPLRFRGGSVHPGAPGTRPVSRCPHHPRGETHEGAG